MRTAKLRLLVAVSSVCAALFVAAPRADQGAARRDADVLKQKFATIAEQGARPTQRPQRTAMTESELNAYLMYEVAPQLPGGVVEPSVAMLGAGRVSGRAVVDLDAVRKQKNPTSLFDPMSYLRGRMPVTAVGTLTTGNGAGRFDLESASLGGVAIPKRVLQEIVAYYSRTPENPSGINLDDSFTLPAAILEIQIERGQAVVVQ
jgi:hypothetical protein